MLHEKHRGTYLGLDGLGSALDDRDLLAGDHEVQRAAGSIVSARSTVTRRGSARSSPSLATVLTVCRRASTRPHTAPRGGRTTEHREAREGGGRDGDLDALAVAGADHGRHGVFVGGLAGAELA